MTTTTRPYLSASTPVRVGDTLTFTAPTVLGHGFDAWRLQPADGTAATVGPALNRAANQVATEAAQWIGSATL